MQAQRGRHLRECQMASGCCCVLEGCYTFARTVRAASALSSLTCLSQRRQTGQRKPGRRAPARSAHWDDPTSRAGQIERHLPTWAQRKTERHPPTRGHRQQERRRPPTRAQGLARELGRQTDHQMEALQKTGAAHQRTAAEGRKTAAERPEPDEEAHRKVAALGPPQRASAANRTVAAAAAGVAPTARRGCRGNPKRLCGPRPDRQPWARPQERWCPRAHPNPSRLPLPRNRQPLLQSQLLEMILLTTQRRLRRPLRQSHKTHQRWRCWSHLQLSGRAPARDHSQQQAPPGGRAQEEGLRLLQTASARAWALVPALLRNRNQTTTRSTPPPLALSARAWSERKGAWRARAHRNRRHLDQISTTTRARALELATFRKRTHRQTLSQQRECLSSKCGVAVQRARSHGRDRRRL
jgi:hypothetical protein